jgi:polyferredoxin
MPIGKTRDKVVLGLGKARGHPHRYTNWRWAVAVLFTLAIAALPCCDILRFDLWGGRHFYLGEHMGLVEVTKHFAFPFLGVNLAIIVVSRFFGRYLCGFVCPYGAVARFAEWLRFRAKTRRQRFEGFAVLITICALLSAITFNFWLDWRVFRDGSPAWIIAAGALLLGMVISFYLFVQRLGLGFCRNWCPSGVYFALLGRDTLNGIEFAHPKNCTDCKACEKACPMDLLPRELSGGKYREGEGFYPNGMSNFALCIRCGDCVSACEGTTARLGVATPLRMGHLPPGARESDERGPAEPNSLEARG